jgi:nucleotide-binding universal stress UspA family protein
MKAFTRILLPTDLSEASLAALRYAAAIARWYGGQITALHVAPTLDPTLVRGGAGAPTTVVTPRSIEDALRDVLAAAPDAIAAGLDFRYVVQAGSAATAIATFAASDATSLIVMGTHGRSGFDRLVAGSVTEKLLARTPCPVLTIPPQAADRPEAATFKHVLCAVDYSPAADRALAFGLDLARQSQGTATVAHVLEWLSDEDVRAHAHYNVAEYRRLVHDEARTRLHERLAQESQEWCAIEEIVSVGRPHRELLRLAADRGCDLITMGTQGRGALGLALFGSATQQVVRAAACPVLVVPPVPPAD